MSILSTIKATFGFSNTASENHFLDGSVANKLSIKRGTPASPGAEVLKIDAGVVSFPQSGATVRFKILTGTTGATAGSIVSIAHNIDVTKLLSITGYFINLASARVSFNFTDSTQDVSCYADATNVYAVNSTLATSNALARPMTILVAYEG